MEAKKLISTLKGFRTRFTNKPDAELEKKSVTNLVSSFGDGAMDALKDFPELSGYVSRVMGTEHESPVGKVVSTGKDGKEYADVNGKVYVIDSVKKTVKRVYKDLSELGAADLALSSGTMPMTVYQKYLRDRFPGEDAPIKKGKLHFRGYRISCDAESGFLIEDSSKRYEAVDTPFDGIPTPKELGDWFNKPKREFTPEELSAAAERGREASRKSREISVSDKTEEAEPDFEELRRRVLRMVADARTKTIDVDPEKFVDMIPFKRWRRKVKSLYTQWKERRIRYAKFLNEVETLTKEETFVVEEKKHRSSFTGTLLPEHEKVGMLVGDKIEVDGKWVDAVPFLLEYLLFHEKRAMSQIMKYAAGEITDVELIRNPLEVDWRVEYKKRALENTAHNARVLCMVYDAVGIVAPQDLLYEADLQPGDRIMISVNGELKTQTVVSVEKGIALGKEIGLLKLDKWIKLPKKENKK